MKINSITCMALALLLAGCGSSEDVATDSPTDETATGVPDIIPEGQRLFERKCAACHGSDGAAGIGGAANLRLSKLDSTAIIRIIDKGKNAMPSFGTQLTKEEMGNIAAYLEDLRK